VVKSEKKSGILTDTPVQAEVQATQESKTKKKSSVPCKTKLIMTKKVKKPKAGNSVYKVTIYHPGDARVL